MEPTSGVSEISEALLSEAQALTGSAHGFISSIDPLTGDNIGHTLRGPVPDSCGVNQPPPVLRRGADGLYPSLWGHALNTRAAFYSNDPASHPVSKGVPEGHIIVKRFLSVPVLLNQELVGQIAVANPPRDYTDADLRNLASLADIYALAIQRMRFEDALRRERDFAALITSNAAVGIVLTDARTGQFVRANQKFCEIVGYTLQEVSSLSFQQLTHPDDLDRSLEGLQKLRIGEIRELAMEKRYLHKDGAPVWVRLAVAPLPARGEGEAALHIAVVEDITLRKRIELELTRARADLESTVEQRTAELRAANTELRHQMELRRFREEELEEAERRYRTVADFTYDWEYWRTPDGTLLYCSPSCERISGYTPSEMAAKPQLLEEIIEPEDRRIWNEHLCAIRTAPGPQVVEFRIRSKSGGTRWIEHSCQPVILPDGQSLGVRASNRDITDRKNAEMTTQHLRQEMALVSRITTAGQLAAALAHELNQPLGAIVCNAQAAGHFLNQAPPDLAELHSSLQDIEDAAKRAGQVIQRLRAMYRRTDPQRGSLELNRLLQETLELLHSELLLRSIAVRTDFSSGLPGISGNSIELQQVVINLVMNALDAMTALPPTGRQLHIQTAQSATGAVQLRIRDSGVGLSPEQIERLGEPFFTSKPKGMGMGLAISRHIIEAHGGRLWATNNPDQGATFYMELPALTAKDL